jgi:hypothetical protein
LVAKVLGAKVFGAKVLVAKDLVAFREPPAAGRLMRLLLDFFAMRLL